MLVCVDNGGILGACGVSRGVSADQSKKAAMLEWPLPKTLKKLRGFLEFTGYYLKFVKGYSTIAWLLIEQLKKDSFQWGEVATHVLKN